MASRICFSPRRTLCSSLVKVRQLYTDGWLVAGVILMLLGAGNCLVGLTNAEQYRRMLGVVSQSGADQSYLSFDEFDELDAHADLAALAPLTEEERKVSYATAHLDFYHAAFLTGRVIFAVGLAMTLLAFIAALRRDTRRAIRRAGPGLGRNP